MKRICILFVGVLLLVGCSGSNTDLPVDPQVAITESKQAMRRWIELINEGKGTDFLLNALPDRALNDSQVRNASGGFTPKFIGKFYEVLPDLHTALQQALLLDPVVRRGDVVYTFPAGSPGNSLFAKGEMFISRTADKWHFNGPRLKR